MTYEELEEQIKQLWPDKCPECGSPAYIGMNNVQCVSKSCRNGSEEEFEKYAKLIGKQLDIAINEVPSVPRPSHGQGQLWVKDNKAGQIVFASGGGSGIDEDDEDTQPGLQAPRSFDWFNDLDTGGE